MSSRLPRLAPLALALLLEAAPGRAGVIGNGSFVKTVAAAPAVQVVPHGLGQVPKALILWTVGSVDETFTSSYRLAFGASDGSTSRSTAAASLDAAGTSSASRRMAPKALTIVQWGEVVVAEADLQAWAANSFTLTWTANDTSPTVIHFVAIGGADVSARVIGWASVGTAVNQSVTGVGFRPSVVLHSLVGAAFDQVPPASMPAAGFGLGAMDAGGGQWISAFFTGNAAGTSDTQRYQRPNRAIAGIDTAQAVAKEAGFVSMDPDGFTVKWVLNDGVATQVLSLALSGIRAFAGSFAKTVGAAPANQSIAGLGFAPAAIVLASFQDVARAAPVGHSRLGLGASDGGAAAASACQDRDGSGNTIVDGLDKLNRVYLKVDNHQQRIDAEATLASLDPDGFTLRFGVNDNVPTEVNYLALAPLTRRRIWTASCTECPVRRDGSSAPLAENSLCNPSQVVRRAADENQVWPPRRAGLRLSSYPSGF